VEWIDSLLKLSQAGSTVLLMVALLGAYRGWWVPGWLYRQLREDYERARDLAEGGTNLTERALRRAESSERKR